MTILGILMTIIYILIGAVIGAIVTLILYVLGFGVQTINCACNILTCNWDGDDITSVMWSWDTFYHVLLFCAIVGAIIGLIYGIFKMFEEAEYRDAENSEKDRKQRIEWANEVKQKAQRIYNICEKNKDFDQPLVSTTYQSSTQMKNIMDELIKAAELQGKVDSIADELTKKGGMQ